MRRKVFTPKSMAARANAGVAEEAGINKALLHYYFKDKQQHLFEGGVQEVPNANSAAF
ncbi:MAG: TetR family transcriptional regulator [Flavobacteriales bacterium]|nr:TetR family transcriptional regulator [Flavobacteriales bacterium]